MTFDAAVSRTKQVPGDNGFGGLTQIDVQKTMKAKLDADQGDANRLFANIAFVEVVGQLAPPEP